MMLNKIFISFILLFSLVNCNSQSIKRYDKAYKEVSKDFLSKEASIKTFGKDISGLYIHESIYPNPFNQKDYSNTHADILSEKDGKQSLKNDKELEKLLRKHTNVNWELDKISKEYENLVVYEGIPNGPLNTIIFSEIVNDRLRVDVIPFFVKSPKYCGSVNKYYFVFEGNEIIKSEKWQDHYECW